MAFVDVANFLDGWELAPFRSYSFSLDFGQIFLRKCSGRTQERRWSMLETLQSTYLSIPVSQVMMLLFLSTMALFFGRLKLALLINYGFALFWGYISNINFLTAERTLHLNSFTFLYLGFGLGILLLALIGFMTHKD